MRFTLSKLRRAQLAVIGMAILLAIYLVLPVQYGVELAQAGTPVSIAMAVALFALPIVGVWALGAEILFAMRADRLAKSLESEGGLPNEPVPVSPTGRPDRAAADALFPRYQAAVESDPESWRAWFRLGIAYEASGDRRRARWATRTAIRLAREHPPAA
jgi:hypothetical protein